MGRKVFISFLGYTNYGACSYYKDDFKSESLRYIQEATLKYITSNETWGPDCVAYILLTKGAEEKNWVDDGHKKDGETIKSEGLCSRLSAMNLPFPVEPVKNLPDGNNEEEIWEIFERVFEKIQDGDELYFDLTHGFRYLPMLILVLGNYAKFLSNVVIKHVSYGNYEGRNKQTNEAPIIDLLPLISLQDWTFAAANFIENGNVKQLVQLSKEEVEPLLKASKGKDTNALSIRRLALSLDAAVKDFQTNRGLDIISSSNIKKVKTFVDEIDSAPIKPLLPVIGKIKDSFGSFHSNVHLDNVFLASRWCFDNGLFQQSATILQEGVVSLIAQIIGIPIDSKADREYVNTAFHKVVVGSDSSVPIETENDKEKVIVNWLKSLDRVVVDAFANLTEVRNDLNHSGMRKSAKNPDSLVRNLNYCLGIFEKLFADYTDSASCNKDEKEATIFINLSNHPSTTWTSHQVDEAKAYGKVVDIPFPEVDEAGDEDYIDSLCNEYIQRITSETSNIPCTVHLMGELNFSFALVNKLKGMGYNCIASTTKRNVTELPDGSKKVAFEFCRFRKY